MDFNFLEFKDKFVPVEKIIELIRDRKINDAVIEFRIDSAEHLFYSIKGRISKEDLKYLTELTEEEKKK